MAEWTNPIFYLNFGGLVCSAYLWWKAPRGTGLQLTTAFAILAIGTGLHFVGDLVDFSEDLDHIFIHAVILLATLALVIGMVRKRSASA